MIRKLLFILFAAIPVLSSFAVTDKEMEEAKAITAKAYLRYANDGSGYLDDVKATTMSQLESKLKAKEKENLKAFNSVKIPSDYASWDKAKLIEFWSITFFTSPNLSEKGKIAKNTVKKRISAMNIGAPAKKEEPKSEPAPEQKPATETQASTPAEIQAAAAPATAEAEIPTAENAIEKQEEILADQNAIAEAEAERMNDQKNDNTWIYVIVLIILIGVVVWLVVFAANMMKKQNPQGSKNGFAPAGADDNELRGQFNKAMTKKNEELKAVTEKLEASQNEQNRLMRTIETLKDENRRLKNEIAHLKSEPRQQPAAAAAAAVALNDKDKAQAAPAQTEKKMPNVIYLGRANARGLFVRADRRLNPGHTIYRLDTRDGLVGTFHVVDEPEVTELAFKNPTEYLAGGCNAIDIEDTAGATRIVTENAGTALFENGCWKVLRKSRIRYE